MPANRSGTSNCLTFGSGRGSGRRRGRFWGKARRWKLHTPNVASVVHSFNSSLIFVGGKLIAPDDAKSRFVLPPLQRNRLTRKRQLPQTTQPAADVADIESMGQQRGRCFTRLLVHPHAQRQNHPGAGAALSSFRHTRQLTASRNPEIVTEVMGDCECRGTGEGRISSRIFPPGGCPTSRRFCEKWGFQEVNRCWFTPRTPGLLCAVAVVPPVPAQERRPFVREAHRAYRPRASGSGIPLRSCARSTRRRR